jgi:hypothetical protein
MKIVIKGVTINEVASKEVENKETGDVRVFRSVDIFIPRDKDDEYSKPKSISAQVVEGNYGLAVFNYLAGMEGQKVCIEGNYSEEKHFVAKGQKYDIPEKFFITAVIDVASIKPVELKNIKVAA